MILPDALSDNLSKLWIVIITAALREPEVTEQDSSLVSVNIHLFDLSFTFLAKCKSVVVMARSKGQGIVLNFVGTTMQL